MTIPKTPAVLLPVGTRVRKCTGDYRLEGFIEAAFVTRQGHERYVVNHEPVATGMLHIYGRGNLEVIATTGPETLTEAEIIAMIQSKFTGWQYGSQNAPILIGGYFAAIDQGGVEVARGYGATPEAAMLNAYELAMARKERTP